MTVCKECGKIVIRRFNKGKNWKVCSTSCWGKYRSRTIFGSKVWNYVDTPQPDPSNGYIARRIFGKKVYVHRLVMEEYLGRKLETHEHVHHINSDRTDNRLENLEVLDAGDHIRLHRVMKREAVNRGSGAMH